MEYTLQRFFLDFFFRDKRKYFNVPTIVLTWLLTLVTLGLVGALVSRGEWSRAGIVLAAGLGLFLVHGLYSYLMMRRQEGLRSRLYKQIYMEFGLPMLGNYGREKADARIMRRLVKTSFRGSRLIEVRIQGEASKVTVSEAKDFLQLLNGLSKDSSAQYLPDFSQLHAGEVSARLLPATHPDLLRYQDEATVLSIADSHASLYLSSSTAYPTVAFEDWSEGLPHFTKVSITGLPENPVRDSSTDRLLEAMGKNFPVSEREWRADFVARGVVLEALEASSVTLMEEKDSAFLFNVCGKISASMQHGFWLSPELRDLSYGNEGLSSFRVVFHDPQDLYQEVNRREFCGKFAAILAKRYGDKWGVSDRLGDQRALVFRRASD